ncbi:MAG TPA: SURF1 family protein [Aeromicrobium sp.]|nr:SURF1 family protein [Aeromicrobium sp.]
MLNRRTILLTLGAFALAALCVRLGFWQWHRMEHKKHEQAIIERHLGVDAVPVQSVLRPGRAVADDDEWTLVRATGTFETRGQVTVKFTPRDGRAGADVVTPLVLPDGSALLVDRGWIPTANTNARPTDIPTPPPGRVTVEGWLRPDNQAGENAVVPVDRQVRAIASHGLEKYVGRELLPGFINLQQPAMTGLAPEPRPHVGHALNFFYALQWWFFAGLALIGPFWFGREPHARAIKSA